MHQETTKHCQPRLVAILEPPVEPPRVLHVLHALHSFSETTEYDLKSTVNTQQEMAYPNSRVKLMDVCGPLSFRVVQRQLGWDEWALWVRGCARAGVWGGMGIG